MRINSLFFYFIPALGVAEESPQPSAAAAKGGADLQRMTRPKGERPKKQYQVPTKTSFCGFVFML